MSSEDEKRQETFQETSLPPLQDAEDTSTSSGPPLDRSSSGKASLRLTLISLCIVCSEVKTSSSVRLSLLVSSIDRATSVSVSVVLTQAEAAPEPPPPHTCSRLSQVEVKQKTPPSFTLWTLAPSRLSCPQLHHRPASVLQRLYCRIITDWDQPGSWRGPGVLQGGCGGPSESGGSRSIRSDTFQA